MSKPKDVVVTISKKHPDSGEPAQPGHAFVIGTLGHKKAWYEVESEELNKHKDADLQAALYKLLHPQTHH